MKGKEKNSNCFERREAIIESVKDAFQAKRIDRKSFEGKSFILWIEVIKEDAVERDMVFEDITAKNSNGLTLKEEIIDDLFTIGYGIDSIELRQGKPKNGSGQIEGKKDLGVVLYLEETSVISHAQPSGKIMKARIVLVPGSPGKLKKPKGYIIRSDKAPYNIGRMIEPGDPIGRVNDIEIIDENDPPLVSRTQAHIGFSAELGFYIQRDSAKTELISKLDNKRHSLGSELSQFPLFNGDIIELNSHVRLLFQIID